MAQYFKESEMEVIVLLEAIESETSCTIQSRFSYSFVCGDMKFNETFVPCVRRASLPRERGAGGAAPSPLWRSVCAKGGCDSSAAASGDDGGLSGRSGRAVVDLERFHQTRRTSANALHFRDAQAHA